MTTDDTRKRAMTEHRRAARAAFADLDLRMAGSSPRQWIGDRGWWVVNVEFQASRVANTAMLNVGVQHLWTFFDGRAFDFGGRVPGVSVDLTGRDEVVRAAAERIAATARRVVLEWDDRLGDRDQHLRWLASGEDDGAVPRIDTALARALLGDADGARGTLLQNAEAMDLGIDWQREQAADARRLAALVADDAAFRAELDQRVARMRQELELEPLPAPVFA